MELKEVWQRFALFDPSLASDHIKDSHQLPFSVESTEAKWSSGGCNLRLHIQYTEVKVGNKPTHQNIFPPVLPGTVQVFWSKLLEKLLI